MARNALRPGYLGVMTRKLGSRVMDVRHAARAREAVEWAATSAQDAESLARVIDPALWEEARRFGAGLEATGKRVLETLADDVKGGGGHYELLYFLVRHHRPAVAVETGVALGYSTAAILAAMAANDHGHLYSSDFPEFRLRDPEHPIGCMVGEELRGRWTLHLRGDRKNLRRILAEVDRVDFVHYDSDKTYGARRSAMNLLAPQLSDGAVVVMDDLQDNLYFRDHLAGRTDDYEVVTFVDRSLGTDSEKYVGISYRPREAASTSS